MKTIRHKTIGICGKNPSFLSAGSLTLCLLIPLWGGCQRGGGEAPGGARKSDKKGQRSAFPVNVQKAQSREVEFQIKAPATLQAFETVQLTARVGGVVERVLFKEGTWVKAGQPLIAIETMRYRLAVRSAEAQLAKAKATLADATQGALRRKEAVATSPGLIPGEEIASWDTRKATADAEVALAQAALEEARLNLRDATMPAPAAGIIETKAVQTGQYLTPGTVLGTLVRRDPLLLRFSVRDTQAKALAVGMMVPFSTTGAEDNASAAKITHIAAQASPETRMVLVTAEVRKEDAAALRPGAFAVVDLAVEGGQRAPVIPESAIRPSDRGFTVFVVNGDVVTLRVIEIGLRTADGLVQVVSGIKDGETIVVRGMEALIDGAKVIVKSQGKPEGPRVP